MKIYIASILIAVAIGIARAEQGGGISSMEGVLRIVTHPCGDSSAPVFFHQVLPTDHLFILIEQDLNTTIREAKITSEALQSWIALFGNNAQARLQTYVKRLQIPKTQHNNLSEIENSRLHAYLQLANYAHFLMKQETAGYTTITGGAQSLLKPDLRKQIGRFVCRIKELLQLNAEELRVFATQDIDGHLLPMDVTNLNSSKKRAACKAAVDLMFDTIKLITVSEETRSVQIPGNI